jgi:RecT family protein
MNDMATAQSGALDLLKGSQMPLMFQLYLNPVLRDQIRALAQDMAKDDLNTPEHLLNKPSACAVVITRAMVWGLDPYLVASMTFQTPNKKMGYEGALINAAIDRHLDGGVHFKHYGDWSRVQGKHRMETSAKGFKYPVPTWTDKDAEGLGITISARVKGEREVRSMTMDLVQCQPRNSTLWALDPKTQICYTGVRRFAKVMVPAALMGLPPDLEDMPREVHMGEADVVIEPEITMPRAAQRIDRDTGEVTREQTIEVPDSHEIKVDEDAPAQDKIGPSLITPRALSLLTQRLQDRELTEQFCSHFAIADPSELPMSKVNDAMKWVEQQNKPAA